MYYNLIIREKINCIYIQYYLLNIPHPLVENPINDYDYKLKLKLNFNSSFRTLHDPTKDEHEKNFILNKWKEGKNKGQVRRRPVFHPPNILL
jgi:hypothetical protein